MIRRLQALLAAAFGIAEEERSTTVADMLATGRRPAGGYWLQLVVAMVIATLGLVLGSAAAVIGAMLVSPLMTPIVHLGMGLAIGSPLLVVRSGLRVASSSIVVVGGAALVVLMLPFQETTSEIAARVSPTALDLAIAGFCAVAGLYSAIRPGSDTTSTAAGTAIGIALVPPLCVVGFGIGTASQRIAGGAALLFTANFCAIMLVSVVGFLLFGYGRVNVQDLERTYADAFSSTHLSGRIARRLTAFFASRASRVLRIAMPSALVLVVFVPLKSALAEVAWEVSVRSAIRGVLADLPGETVESAVRIEDHQISVRVVVITDADRALRIRASLRQRIARIAPDVEPRIDVLSVANAAALVRNTSPVLTTAPAVAAANAHPDFSQFREEITRALKSWPTESSGPLLGWRFGVARMDGAAEFSLVHLGTPLEPAARESLSNTLATALGGPARITDVSLSVAPIERPPSAGAEWLVAVARELALTDALAPDAPDLVACVGLARVDDAAIAKAARAFATTTNARVRIERQESEVWSFRWSTSPCGTHADAGNDTTDAGADVGAP
jgi:uncharacterized hydrophobic protein (TIGR00271 family)